MRPVWVAGACLVAALAACGEGTRQPHEIADDVVGAVATGDHATWRALHAEDAIAVLPDGETIELFGASPFVFDDFDGDGIVSFADELQFRGAMHHPARQEMTWDCVTVADAVAECSMTVTDVFVEAGGAEPMHTASRLTFEDGLITVEELLASPDPVASDRAAEAYSATVAAYEEWVRDVHPDAYPTLFHGPCCNAAFVALPDAVAAHHVLIEEFFPD
jgi:hypothetical protein